MLEIRDEAEEENLQRRELERLLATAKDKDRREMLEKALSSFEHANKSPNRPNNHISAIHPGTHPHLFGNQKMPVEIMKPGSAARTRPVSAQRRRPSLGPNLDAIPENRSMLQKSVDAEAEVDLTVDDIDDIFTSSMDARFPARNLVRCRTNSNSELVVSANSPIVPYESSPVHLISPNNNSKPYTNKKRGKKRENKSKGKSSTSTSSSSSSEDEEDPFRTIDDDDDEEDEEIDKVTSMVRSTSMDSFRPIKGSEVKIYQPTTTTTTNSSKEVDTAANEKCDYENNMILYERRAWISTGLLPQFLTISLKEKWIFRKLEVRCRGVESMSVVFDGKHTEVSRLGDNLFVLDISEPIHVDLRGIAFKKLTLYVHRTSDPFFAVSDINIRALPYV